MQIKQKFKNTVNSKKFIKRKEKSQNRISTFLKQKKNKKLNLNLIILFEIHLIFVHS